MPRGGSREGAGRKKKWGEEAVPVGVPSSISNDLIVVLESLWDSEIRGKKLINALEIATQRQRVKKYETPISAGENSTSSAGGGAIITDAEQQYEEVDLHEELIKNPNKTIIVPVSGDSMTGIGIYPGDWLIVEQVNSTFYQPKEGEIIVVAVNDEFMVKRYGVEKGQPVLFSENAAHRPIKYSKGSIYVQGVVKSAIRRNLSKL